MNENKPNTNTQNKKLKSDWTDKKFYLVPYRGLKFCTKDGVILDEIHEIFSFKHVTVVCF